MRHATLVVVIVMATALMAIWLLPRRPQAARTPLRAPTAEEEAGGEPGALESEMRPAPQVPDAVLPQTRADNPARRDPPSGVRAAAPRGSGSAPEEQFEQAAPPRSTPIEAPRGRKQGADAGPGEGRGREAGPPEVVQAEAPERAPVLTPPVLLDPAERAYPSDAYQLVLDQDALTPRLRIDAAQGRVVLKILVRADGSVGEVGVAEASGSRVLDDAAVRAARGWVFAPATRAGDPIEAWVVIPVRFVVP